MGFKASPYNPPLPLLPDVPMKLCLDRRLRQSGLLVLVSVLCACSGLDKASRQLTHVVTPYKIDIVQGNFVSREQAAALTLGMKRNQVRDILGTPLLASVFHADRWDYVFTFKRQGSEPQSRKVTVFFEGDVLMRVDADALPSEAEFVTSLDSGRTTGPVPVLEMPAAKLQPKVKPVVPSNVTPLPALPSSYPPLEPGEY